LMQVTGMKPMKSSQQFKTTGPPLGGSFHLHLTNRNIDNDTIAKSKIPS
jgi:hypothetical protein